MHGSNRISPEFALLGFLYQASGYGYELHQRLLDKLGNIWHVSQSQTYNIIKRLEVQGYIRSMQVEQEKHPARQVLQLTDAGSERFINWLSQPTKSSVHAIRVEFITRLYFTQLYFPEQTHRMLLDQIELVKTDAASLQQLLENLPEDQVFNRLAIGLRLDLLRSVIRWLEMCGQSLTTGKSIRSEDA